MNFISKKVSPEFRWYLTGVSYQSTKDKWTFCAKWQKSYIEIIEKYSFLCKVAGKFHLFCNKKFLFCAKWQGSSMKKVLKIVHACAKWQEDCIIFRTPRLEPFNPVFVFSMRNRVESELDWLCVLAVRVVEILAVRNFGSVWKPVE